MSRFSLQSDSRRIFIWRMPGNRWCRIARLGGEIIQGSRTDLHVQMGTMTCQIYRDVILEQHVRLFRDAMGVEFVFMNDNARPQRANIVNECLHRSVSPVWTGQHFYRT
ncbi:uncharacterized protein TNCV_3918481 [Trichonephila clavipes]|nr:uncharacterized protein TNCV_3918481 [Trichonephila clavipes]